LSARNPRTCSCLSKRCRCSRASRSVMGRWAARSVRSATSCSRHPRTKPILTSWHTAWAS
jgi:hypothetical protein